MMKRLFALLLACLLLVGCTPAPIEETTVPTQTEQTLPPAEPTEPSGAYDPGSEIEANTDGAVRAYPLAYEQAYAIACMGDDLLVFSEVYPTKLVVLSGDNLFETASVQLSESIFPGDRHVNISEKGIMYYSEQTNELVTLDTTLKEIGRTELPEIPVNAPVISADRKFIYYCTQDGIREYSMENGFSRLIKELSYETQALETLLLNGTVLCCNIWDEDGRFSTLYLSTENGKILWEGESDFYLHGYGDTWYCVASEGTMSAYVFGDADNNARMLIPRDYSAGGTFLEAGNCLITENYEADNADITVEYYDLDTGKCLSTLYLPDAGYVGNFCTRQGEHLVYFLGNNYEEDAPTVYRWDVDMLPSGDETDYSSPHYTLEYPDTDGLGECRAYADEIGAKYGVHILIGEEATKVQPWDYVISAEYQVPVVRQSLERLDQALSVYPEGMLKDAAWSTPDQVIYIGIARSLNGSVESGSLNSAVGIQFFDDDGNTYVSLAVGWNLEQTLYHELYHAMENRLMSASAALYDWEYLNPDGFDYDYDYVANQYRTDTTYVDDDDRYFIDLYSMSFPREDRARILEYAMIPEGADYFDSEPMQKKLLALCTAMREAFGLKKSTETFLWEQYLNQSLAPNT